LPLLPPLPPPPLPPDGSVETLLLDPPSQPELAKPTIPSDTPQRFTGRLIGASRVFPDSTETLPLPVTLPLPEA
jgi:hypothetical protein